LGNVKVAIYALLALALTGGWGIYRTRELAAEYAWQAELLRRESPAAAKRRGEARFQDLMRASHGPRAALEAVASQLPTVDPDVRKAWVSDGATPAFDPAGTVVVSSPVIVEGRRLTVGLAYFDHELAADLARTDVDLVAAIGAEWRYTIHLGAALLVVAVLAFAIRAGFARRRSGTGA
jgi:hypothetical protein